jgi:hypothetical protein
MLIAPVWLVLGGVAGVGGLAAGLWKRIFGKKDQK